MLANFIRTIVELGRESQGARFFNDEKLPGKVFLQHGDAVTPYEVPPRERGGEISTLPSFISACLDDAIMKKPEIYVAEDAVVALINRDDRKERVTCPLNESDRWRTVCFLSAGKSFSPRDAVKFLRFDLAGSDTEAVVQAVSRIDFARKSDGRSDVGHGKETLGKSVEMAVQQASDIPEEFNIRVPVFTTPGCRETTTVKCGIYLDMTNESIVLRVLPDECEIARGSVLQGIFGDLVTSFHGQEIPVYMGCP